VSTWSIWVNAGVRRETGHVGAQAWPVARRASSSPSAKVRKAGCGQPALKFPGDDERPGRAALPVGQAEEVGAPGRDLVLGGGPRVHAADQHVRAVDVEPNDRLLVLGGVGRVAVQHRHRVARQDDGARGAAERRRSAPAPRARRIHMPSASVTPKAVVELVDVAHHVAAELRRRVRVDGQSIDGGLLAGLGAPHLRPAEKTRCSPVSRRSPARARHPPSHAIRYASSAIDSPPRSPMFSPTVNAPLTCARDRSAARGELRRTAR
jgi:hypothetical protein